MDETHQALLQFLSTWKPILDVGEFVDFGENADDVHGILAVGLLS